jgi:hypothetical protein
MTWTARGSPNARAGHPAIPTTATLDELLSGCHYSFLGFGADLAFEKRRRSCGLGIIDAVSVGASRDRGQALGHPSIQRLS